MRSPNRRPGFSALEFLLVGSTIMIILAVLVPGLQHSRRAAERIRCLNNLNQISIAVSNYETIMGVLPPGVVNRDGPVVNEAVGYHMSWAAQLTPVMDYSSLFDSMDWTHGAYSAAGAASGIAVPEALRCSADPLADDMKSSSYAGCVGGSTAQIDENGLGLLYLNSAVRDVDIADGRSNTLLVGEVRVSWTLAATGLNWLSGTAATLRSSGNALNSTIDADYEVVTPSAGGFGSWHDGTVSMLFADGSGRSMNEDVDVEILVKMGDRADGSMMEQPNRLYERRQRNAQLWRSVRFREDSP